MARTELKTLECESSQKKMFMGTYFVLFWGNLTLLPPPKLDRPAASAGTFTSFLFDVIREENVVISKDTNSLTFFIVVRKIFVTD